MKYLIALLLIIGLTGYAQAMDSCMTGSWYDPNTDDGRGIDIQVLDRGVIAGYYYTWYGTERELFTLNGANDADFEVEFNGYQSLFEGSYWVGKAWIDVVDDDHIVFSHTWKHDFHNTRNTMRWCKSGCEATYEYTRLTSPIPCSDG